MAVNVVATHTFLGVDSLGDEAVPSRFAFTPFVPGKLSHGERNCGNDESEDDSTSTGCSNGSRSSSPDCRTSSDTEGSTCSGERSRLPTVELSVEETGCALPLPPPGLLPSLAEEGGCALPPPPGLELPMRPPPGLELVRGPPGMNHGAMSCPPGTFGLNLNQSWPMAYGVHQGAQVYGYSWFNTQMAVPKSSAPKASKCTSQIKAAASDIPDSERTTIMLRNLPTGFSRDALAEVLDQEGFNAKYDFVYMPINFKTEAAFGYAFVNLVMPEDAQQAMEHFTGFSWPGAGEEVTVEWCSAQQGLEGLIERFRSSPVMHKVVPDALRPAVYRGGVRDVFPAPTAPIKMPAMRVGGD